MTAMYAGWYTEDGQDTHVIVSLPVTDERSCILTVGNVDAQWLDRVRYRPGKEFACYDDFFAIAHTGQTAPAGAIETIQRFLGITLGV